MGIDTGLGTHSLFSSSTQARSDRLVFFAYLLERETGIEPASLAWKARVLPLNYSRMGIDRLSLRIVFRLVEEAGFEPA
jgi:hypothetical protein